MPNTKKITKPTWQLNHHGKRKTLKKNIKFPCTIQLNYTGLEQMRVCKKSRTYV